MKSGLYWTLFSSLVSVAFCSKEDAQTYQNPFPDPASATAGEIWPLPQKVEYGKENRTVRKGSISIIFQGLRDVDCDILEFAKRTYQKDWFFSNRILASHVPGGLRLVIRTDSKCPEKDEYPQHGMNEEYFLQVPSSGDAVLEAEEVWGILRGLESFSQLIFQQNGQHYLKTAIVHDWPEYPVRGILVDTSRHYLPKKTILRQLDIMAQNKFNLLHWHIVDSQSFPYVSRRFPHISERVCCQPDQLKRGFRALTVLSTHTTETQFKTFLITRRCGASVMMEFDTPGHMGSWKGELGLLAECKDSKGHPIPSNIIDPTLDRNYVFLKNFFDEILGVFPDRFIHLGGDEVAAWIDCWKSNPKIREFMERKGMGDNTTSLENYYYSRLQDTIGELLGMEKDARMVFWQEVFQFNNPRPGTIAHLWQYTDEERPNAIARYTANGHPVILSSCWYLNYISYGRDYDKYYLCDPRGFNGTEEQKKLVLGGIAAVWGEFINSGNVETVLWPRASTVAERLWSNPKHTLDVDAAWPRLHEHSCRLIRRGYRVIPANGPDFCLNEYEEP